MKRQSPGAARKTATTVTLAGTRAWHPARVPDTPPPSLEPWFSLDLDALQGAAAHVDALTQTLTRPALLERLAEQQARADGSGQRFAVYLVDVDALRGVNDRHGVRMGDAVLISLAERMRALCSGDSDPGLELALGRYDGDGLLLANRLANGGAALGWGEQLRSIVAHSPVLGSVSITVSIGVALHRIGEGLDELLARTEKALHLAKQFGPDRVELAPDPAPAAARSSPTRAAG